MKRITPILFAFSLFFISCSLTYAALESPILTKSIENIDVTISWTPVDGATGYTFCYSTYPDGAPIVCTDMETETTFSATLWQGASYYVACKAYDENESSGYSNVELIKIAGESSTPGTRALEHTVYISENIGIRIAGSDAETSTRNYIINKFLDSGLAVSTQKFEFESDGAFKESFNVIADIPGASTKQIIVGAHYDSVDVGEGASDNASGVGALIATAEALKFQDLPYTIKFIAFGAEEVGLKGSRHYASQMSTKDISNTIGMINLDTLVGGDKIYVYGSADEEGWIREQALNIARAMGIPLETNPGLNADYPAGTTGDWSDHAPFKALGIPYAYFEATNWEIGNLDGYAQTETFGAIWHTENDTMEFLQREYPGRVEEQLTAMMNTLNELLMTIDAPDSENLSTRKKQSVVLFRTRNGDPL